MEVCPSRDANVTLTNFISKPLSSTMLDQIFTAKSLHDKPVRFEIGEIGRRHSRIAEQNYYDNLVFMSYREMTKEQRQECELQLYLLLDDTKQMIVHMRKMQTALDQGFARVPMGYSAASGQTHEQYIDTCINRLKQDKRYFKKARKNFSLTKYGMKSKGTKFWTDV